MFGELFPHLAHAAGGGHWPLGPHKVQEQDEGPSESEEDQETKDTTNPTNHKTTNDNTTNNKVMADGIDTAEFLVECSASLL